MKRLDDKLLLVDIHLLESRGMCVCLSLCFLVAPSSASDAPRPNHARAQCTTRCGTCRRRRLRSPRGGRLLTPSTFRRCGKLPTSLQAPNPHLASRPPSYRYTKASYPSSVLTFRPARPLPSPPWLRQGVQSQIDLQSGVLHAEEKDYKTAYSYFFEAFEQLQSLDDPQAKSALKYMLLCKASGAKDCALLPRMKSRRGTWRARIPPHTLLNSAAAVHTRLRAPSLLPCNAPSHRARPHPARHNPPTLTMPNDTSHLQVMTGDAADVPGLVNGKGGLKYQGPDLDAMRAIASASADRSLKEFEDALSRYKQQLGEDPIINAHLQTLYDNLLVRGEEARG